MPAESKAMVPAARRTDRAKAPARKEAFRGDGAQSFERVAETMGYQVTMTKPSTKSPTTM